ncbi:MAG: type II toxin-antitoxin system MqsA family antitoxin [Euryarchaeota archaeon]|nr:type II toxin-antitoxin system MqsA family antitoxin [Euryarchaeota archaeon]MCG2735851.1 type II toxin-antitoxin system MqsA family antitoxin [Candidatus Methanoperedenaceae archaeon]
MKCVICGSQDIKEKKVDEEIKLENDLVMVNINALVCSSCGERYYNRQTMKMLEDIEEKLKNSKVKLKVIGSILRFSNKLSGKPAA